MSDESCTRGADELVRIEIERDAATACVRVHDTHEAPASVKLYFFQGPQPPNGFFSFATDYITRSAAQTVKSVHAHVFHLHTTLYSVVRAESSPGTAGTVTYIYHSSLKNTYRVSCVVGNL